MSGHLHQIPVVQMVIGAREDQTGTMGQHVAEVAPAQAMCTSAMMETRIIVKRRTAWVLSLSADSIKLQSAEGGTVSISCTPCSRVQCKHGPASPEECTEASTKTKISHRSSCTAVDWQVPGW